MDWIDYLRLVVVNGAVFGFGLVCLWRSFARRNDFDPWQFLLTALLNFVFMAIIRSLAVMLHANHFSGLYLIGQALIVSHLVHSSKSRRLEALTWAASIVGTLLVANYVDS